MKAKQKNSSYLILFVVLGACSLAFSLPFIISRMTNPSLVDPNLIIPNTGLDSPTPTSTDRILTVEAFANLFFTPTRTPKELQTPTQRAFTFTPLPTITNSATVTRIFTFTVTSTLPNILPSVTSTLRFSPPHTPTWTASATFTFTPSRTLTPSPTRTPTLTASRTPTLTPSRTPIPTDTNTPEPPPTNTPEPPPTDTPKPPPTDTPEPPPTDTPEPPPTDTPAGVITTAP